MAIGQQSPNFKSFTTFTRGADNYTKQFVDLATPIAGEDINNDIQWVSDKVIAGTTSNDLSYYVSSGYVGSAVVKASAGRLVALRVYNSGTSSTFLHTYNGSTVPADGTATTPIEILVVPATSQTSLDTHEKENGDPEYTNGICFANSSTGTYKTLGAANLFVKFVYK